jgi:hypothetical protein
LLARPGIPNQPCVPEIKSKINSSFQSNSYHSIFSLKCCLFCVPWKKSSISTASHPRNQEVSTNPSLYGDVRPFPCHASFVGARKHSAPYLLIIELLTTFRLWSVVDSGILVRFHPADLLKFRRPTLEVLRRLSFDAAKSRPDPRHLFSV